MVIKQNRDKNSMTDSEKITEIARLRKEVREAEKISCSCSSFQVQYDGCSCQKSKSISKAKSDLEQFLNSLT